MKQNAPSAPHRMSSSDMLKMLTSRFWRLMASRRRRPAGVDAVDEILQAVIAREVYRRFFFFLCDVHQEHEDRALDESDHRAVEPDAQRFGKLLKVDRLRGSRFRERRAERVDRADESERRHE